MSDIPVLVLRWYARFSAVLIGGLFVTLMAGEILSPQSGPPYTPAEWSGITLATIACLAMLAACRWQLPGALVSLGALIALASIVHSRFLRNYLIMVVAAVPGLLFLLDWAIHRWILLPAAHSAWHRTPKPARRHLSRCQAASL